MKDEEDVEFDDGDDEKEVDIEEDIKEDDREMEEKENPKKKEKKKKKGKDDRVIGSVIAIPFVILLIFGLLLLLLGILISAISNVIHNPGQFADNYSNYETWTRWLDFFSGLTLYTGLLTTAFTSFFAGLMNPKMDPYVRGGLTVAAGLILGFMAIGLV